MRGNTSFYLRKCTSFKYRGVVFAGSEEDSSGLELLLAPEGEMMSSSVTCLARKYP